MMLYQWHELSRNWMAPWIHQAEANAKLFSDPNSWLSTLPGADRLAASNELIHRLGKDYEKPRVRTSTRSKSMALRSP